jgi:hypothetical protein
VILTDQIMCVVCENPFMVWNKCLVHGTSVLLILSPPLGFSIEIQIIHSLSTGVALT